MTTYHALFIYRGGAAQWEPLDTATAKDWDSAVAEAERMLLGMNDGTRIASVEMRSSGGTSESEIFRQCRK